VRRSKFSTLASLAATVAIGQVAFTVQRAVAYQENDYKISERVDNVLLDVSVRDHEGRFVSGLERGNFTAFDDGRPRPITYFSAYDLPSAVGLVVDNSGSMAARRTEVIAAGLAFARESNPRDQFFVVNFNDVVWRGLPVSIPFTNDLQLLKKGLYYGQARGRTALFDAIAYSLKHLEHSKQQKRTLVVVSDGRDNASKISYPLLQRTIEASRATVYTIAMSDPEGEGSNARILRKIAKLTGGEFFEPRELADIETVFDRIAGDLQHRYTIGYVPEPAGGHPEIRTIRVIVREKGRKLRARTRTTYSTAPLSEMSEELKVVEARR
jgi:Ca-activated chloride channel homolog